MFASVLATSGSTTGAEGESIGDSWKFSHLADAFSTQDAALAARDSNARTLAAVVAATCNDDFSGLSEAASQHPISWNHGDQRK